MKMIAKCKVESGPGRFALVLTKRIEVTADELGDVRVGDIVAKACREIGAAVGLPSLPPPAKPRAA